MNGIDWENDKHVSNLKDLGSGCVFEYPRSFPKVLVGSKIGIKVGKYSETETLVLFAGKSFLGTWLFIPGPMANNQPVREILIDSIKTKERFFSRCGDAPAIEAPLELEGII